jgi:hypothetical protein
MQFRKITGKYLSMTAQILRFGFVAHESSVTVVHVQGKARACCGDRLLSRKTMRGSASGATENACYDMLNQAYSIGHPISSIFHSEINPLRHDTHNYTPHTH